MTDSELLLLDKYVEEIAESMKQRGITISDAFRKQLIESACSKCPVCGETVFNQILLGPDLEEHILRKNDDAHLVLDVLNS
jgi:hypothetical protein